MKQFVVFIGKIFLVLLLSAFALDFIYTTVFRQSETRNKIENVIHLKPQNYDARVDIFFFGYLKFLISHFYLYF
jgi:hypothetical protein